MNGLTDTHGRARRAGTGQAGTSRVERSPGPNGNVLISWCFYFSTSAEETSGYPQGLCRVRASRVARRWRGCFCFFSPQGSDPPLPIYLVMNVIMRCLHYFFFPKKATLNNSMTLCGLQAWTFRQLASIKLYLLKNNRRFHSGIVLVVITCFVS